MRLHVPHHVILRPYLLRAVCLWLLVRLMVIAVKAWGEATQSKARGAFAGGSVSVDLLQWTLSGAIGTLSVCALLGFVDVRKRHERVFLGNLGVGDGEIVLMYVAGAVIGELTFALLGP